MAAGYARAPRRPSL